MTKKELKQQSDIASLENALASVKNGGSLKTLLVSKARKNSPRNKK